jgi:hypothetical protein
MVCESLIVYVSHFKGSRSVWETWIFLVSCAWWCVDPSGSDLIVA